MTRRKPQSYTLTVSKIRKGGIKYKSKSVSTSTNGARSGGIKKPRGKKLPSGYARCRIFREPCIEHSAVFKARASEPPVVFGSIASPTNQVLVSFSASAGVDDLLYEIFFETVGSKDWLWLCHLAAREKIGVVGEERF